MCVCEGGGGGSRKRIKVRRIRQGDRIGRGVGMRVDRTPSNLATPSFSCSVLITGVT